MGESLVLENSVSDESEFIKDQFDSNFTTSASGAYNPGLGLGQHSESSFGANSSEFLT